MSFFFFFLHNDSIHELGRSHGGSNNESEPKARTDCTESNQSKECSVAVVKTQQKMVQQFGASAAGTTGTGVSGVHKLRTGQQQKQTLVRRKVNVTKQKAPAKADVKPQPQVINRARGTLHGLSTIKRHGNVRVT